MEVEENDVGKEGTGLGLARPSPEVEVVPTGAPERREPERSEGERSGGGPVTRQAVGAPNKTDPEVLEKPKRRKFTAEYKKRIVEEADACTEPGQVGAVLRREGL